MSVCNHFHTLTEICLHFLDLKIAEKDARDWYWSNYLNDEYLFLKMRLFFVKKERYTCFLFFFCGSETSSVSSSPYQLIPHLLEGTAAAMRVCYGDYQEGSSYYQSEMLTCWKAETIFPAVSSVSLIPAWKKKKKIIKLPIQSTTKCNIS